MGWCSGGSLLGEIWDEIKDYVEKEDDRVKLYKKLIDCFECHDMDCYEAIEESPDGREALRLLHPEWYEEEG